MSAPKGRGPVVGKVPSRKQQMITRQERDKTSKMLSMSLLVVVVIIAACAATTGVLSSTSSDGQKQAAAEVKKAEDPTKAVVKRPLPPGVKEEDVVKWVPIRQPSGRTELEAWTSIDHHWAEMPQIIDEVMAKNDDRMNGESTNQWPIEDVRTGEVPEAD